MEILRNSQSGTLESCDVFVTISKGNGGVNIEIESPVLIKYGKHIKNLVKSMIDEMKIEDIDIKIVDRGALDYVLKSRVETAIMRATKEE